MRSRAFGLFLDDLAIFYSHPGHFSSKQPDNPDLNIKEQQDTLKPGPVFL